MQDFFRYRHFLAFEILAVHSSVFQTVAFLQREISSQSPFGSSQISTARHKKLATLRHLKSAHIQLSAAIQFESVSTRKDASDYEANSSSEASEESSEDYVVQEFGSDSSEDDEDDNISLAKLASNNCDDSDSDNVPLSALTKHSI